MNSSPGRRLPPPAYLLPLLIIAAELFSFRVGVHRRNVEAGLGYADFYWSQFWITSYSDGFVRRALLGSLVRLVFDNGASILELAAVQLAVTAALLGLSMTIVHRAIAAIAPPEAALTTAALFGFGPFGPLLFETTGDPLQLALLLYLSTLLATGKAAEPMRWAALGLAALIGALAHEASLFFTVPHLAFAHGAARGVPLARRWISAFAGALALAAAFAVLASRSSGSPTFFFASAVHHAVLKPALDATPPFGELLRREIHEYFAGATEIDFFLVKLAAFAAAPAALALFAMSLARGAARVMTLFAFYLAASAPLYAIAHDWGRFAALTLIVAFATELTSVERGGLDPASEAIASHWDALTSALADASRGLFAVPCILAGVVLAASGLWTDYRINGSKTSLIAALLFASIGWLRLRGRTRARFE